MTKAKRLTAAIKAEIATLKNDLQILAAQQSAAQTDAAVQHYARLKETAAARLSLLTGLHA